MKPWAPGFGVEGLEFRVEGLGLRELRVEGLGLRELRV